MNDERIEALRNLFKEHKIDSFIVNSPTSLNYLFGYTGTNGLGFITTGKSYFITDFRYKDQSVFEVSAAEIILAEGHLSDSLINIDEIKKCRKTGFEASAVYYDQFQSYKQILTGSELISCHDLVENIEAVKSPKEIGYITRASEITVEIYKELQSLIITGVTEKDIAAEISYRALKLGGDGDAFPPIVLFGARTALPHGTPGEDTLKEGDLIQLDFGVRYKGYCSDFSRALVAGKLSRNQREIYLAVRESIDRTVEVLKSGMPVKEIDLFAREIIEKRGFGRYFGHSIGHGVGLAIHALPKLSRSSDEILVEGNVFTIEPGIYLTGSCGIRIEDLISLDESGVRVLTDTPRDIISL
ncbi:MAG: aminopeptidase P family protein [bacterium]|nr:aminopeptidase P family protein [bacterium]